MQRKPTYEELERRIQQLERAESERQQVTKELIESEKKYRQFFETTNDAVFVHLIEEDGLPGRFIEANDIACSRLGYTKEELLQLTPLEIGSGESNPDPVEIIKTLKDNGRSLFETIHVTKEGGRIPVESHVRLFDFNGKKAVLSISRDITGRKKAEQSIRDANRFARETQRIARVGGWKANPHTDYLEWTEGVYEIIEEAFDYRPASLTVGMKYYLPQDVPVIREKVTRCLSTGEPFTMETQILTAKGRSIWVELRGIAPVVEGERSAVFGTLQDITERKRVEEALMDSVAVQRAMMQSLPAGVVIVDSTTRIIESVNQAASILFGAPEDYILGHRCHDFICPAADNHCPICDLNKTIDNSEREIICNDGSRLSVLKSVKRIRIGGKDKLIECFIDISERKQAERALQASEQKFFKAFQNAPLLMTISTVEDGRCFDVNNDFVRVTGYSREKALGSTSVELGFISSEDRDRLSEHLKSTGSVRGMELKATRADGSELTCLYSGEIIEVEGELRLLSIASDITERKRIEIALIESEEKYRTLLEANPDPLVVYDMEGRVVYFNPAFTTIFGWSLEDRLGKKMDDFVPEKAWPETKLMIDNVRIGKCFSGIETCRYRRNGETIPVSISGSIYRDNNSNFIGSIINLRDISNQKKMELQLQQAQKMEAIGNLAGGIAHDFNNILSPIVGYAEMLLLDATDDGPLKKRLSHILAAAETAKKIVNQILTFSRQSNHEKKPVNVQHVIREALKLVRSSLPATIDIIEDISNNCDLIMADSTQLHQIIMNLCTNAYHAMEETGGKIFVCLKEVELTDESSHDLTSIPVKYVCLTVTDTGMGMNQSTIDRIFDPYFTSKKPGKGTGLGLAVVHGIVMNHGGRIEVTSEPGKGAEFKVYLPVIEDLKEDAQFEVAQIQRGNECILLVDDKKDVIDIEQQMLEYLGYHVIARTSSIEALEVFLSNPYRFDLVITDMTMPNMTGDKLLQELIKVRPDVPVILCTGFSEMISEEKSLTLGVKGFLMKPVAIHDLSNMIRKVLDNCCR